MNKVWIFNYWDDTTIQLRVFDSEEKAMKVAEKFFEGWNLSKWETPAVYVEEIEVE